jgi:hypothetical protein
LSISRSRTKPKQLPSQKNTSYFQGPVRDWELRRSAFAAFGDSGESTAHLRRSARHRNTRRHRFRP